MSVLVNVLYKYFAQACVQVYVSCIHCNRSDVFQLLINHGTFYRVESVALVFFLKVFLLKGRVRRITPLYVEQQ
jgi:hypothetical protein